MRALRETTELCLVFLTENANMIAKPSVIEAKAAIAPKGIAGTGSVGISCMVKYSVHLSYFSVVFSSLRKLRISVLEGKFLAPIRVVT